MLKRSSVSFASAAFVAALALGVPATAAAPGGHGPHANSPAAAGQGNQAQGNQQAVKRLAAEQRRVAVAVRVKDAGLVRAVRSVTRAALAVGEAEVLASIEADRASLADLRAAAAAATSLTEVRAIGDQVKGVRTEAYQLVISGLRRAERYEVRAAENTETVAGLSALADAAELDGYDVTAVLGLLDLAVTANDDVLASVSAAQDAALTVTAFGTREEQRAFLADLGVAGDLLGSLEDQLDEAAAALAGLGYPDEPVEDEDETDEVDEDSAA